MSGRADQHQLVVAQRHDVQLLPPRRQRDDAEVDLAVDAGPVDLVGAPVEQAQVHLRVRREEALHGRRQRVEPDAVDRRDHDRASDGVRPMLQRLLERGQAGHHLLGAGVHQLARVGDSHVAAGPPLDQPAPVLAFQVAELLADRRLGHEVQAGRPREAAALDQVAERLEGLDGH